MRTLQQHIAEKLVINKNFVSSNDSDYKFINDLIDKYIISSNRNYNIGECLIVGTGTIYNDIGVTLSDNNLDKEFGKDNINKCKKIAVEMFKFGDVYRFVYGQLYNNNPLNENIITMFDEIQKSNIEFEEIFFDVDKGYFVEHYATNEYMIFTEGTEKYACLYISVKD